MCNLANIQTKLFLVLLVAALFLTAACNGNNASNSNVATLYRNTPPPQPEAPTLLPTLSPSAAPLASPSPEISPSTTPPPLPVASIPPPADEPQARGDNAIVVTSNDTLMIPVVGVRPEDLRDTFTAARSQGRVHDAIDIMAAGGTPVVAVTDGKILQFFDSVRGGITIYQLSPDEHTVYYYAHLQRRAENLHEGDFAKQGTLIGYVGDTGNAGTGNYHLHFAVSTITDPKHFHDGTSVDPYPLLRRGKPGKQL